MPKTVREQLRELADQYGAYVEGDADPTGAYAAAMRWIEYMNGSRQRVTRATVYKLVWLNAAYYANDQKTPPEKRETFEAIARSLNPVIWPE